MKIPTPDFLNVAPQGQAPNLKVEGQGGFDALEKGFQQAGQAVDKISAEADRIDKQAIATDVANAMSQLETKSTNAIHGNPMGVADGTTPEDAFNGGGQDTGFIGLRGKAAAEASTSTYESLDDARQKIRDSLNDERAQKLFDLHAAQLMRQNQTVIEGHINQQNEVAAEDSLKNLQDAAVHAAAMNPDVDLGAQLRIAGVAGVASGMGRGKDFEERVVRDTSQRVTMARLDTLMQASAVAASKGDLDTARASQETAERVFNENKASLGEHLAHYYGEVFKEAKVKDNGMALASSILDASRKPNGFIDRNQAVAAWQALPPERKTQEAKVAFDHELEAAQKAEIEVKADKFNDAAGAWDSRKNLNDVPTETAKWMKMNDQLGWHKLEEWDKEDKRARKEGANTTTDAQRFAYTTFETDIKAHPDKYAGMSLAQFKYDVWDKLAKSDRERAGNLFAGSHGEVKPDQLSGFQNHMLIERGRDAGLFPGGSDDVAKWDKEAADFYYGATKYIEKKATDYHRTKREPPSDETVQGWVDDLLKKGKVPGTGYTVPLLGTKIFEKGTTRLESMQNGTGFEPTWSDDEKKKAGDMLQKKGMPVTDETIDATLRIVNGMNPKLERQAQPTYPTNAQELNEAGDDYGLDLTQPETPPIPGALESVQD